MTNTRTVKLKLPDVLPHGWKKAVGEALNMHRNTVQHAIKRGGSDPTYLKIMKCAKEKFGVPVTIKEQ